MSFNWIKPLIRKTPPRSFGREAGFSDSAPTSTGGHAPKGRDLPRAFSPETEAKVRGLSGYGVPAGLFAVFMVIVVYAVSTRDSSPPSGLFPRAGTGFPESGRLDRKLSRLEERIRLNPNDIQAFFEAGLLKFQKGPERYIDAISDLEAARSRGLADIRTFYYLGRMYQAVGLYDFALEEYRRFLNNRPEDLEVRMLTAKLLFSSGKYPLAVKEYADLNVRHPKNIIVLENLALSRWKNAQDPKPILDAMGSLGAEAAFRAGYVSGRISYENKDYAAAAPLLARAAADLGKYPEFPDGAGLYQMLSDSYIKLKSEPQAIDALNELLKISPANDEARSLLARLTKARNKAAAKKKK